MICAIFPGHVGKDSGAIDLADPGSKDDLHTIEAVLTYAIAGRIYDLCIEHGVETIMPIGSFAARLRASERASCGIEIHTDVCSDSKVSGFHCIYNGKSKRGKLLAESIDRKMALTMDRHSLPHPDDRGLFMLEKTSYPCVIVEVGYISNPIEESWLWNREHQKTIAQDIFQGIREFMYAK